MIQPLLNQACSNTWQSFLWRNFLQSKPPLTQPESVTSCFVLCYMGEETPMNNPILWVLALGCTEIPYKNVLSLTHQGESIFIKDLETSSYVDPVPELKTEQHCLLLAFLSLFFAAKWGAFLAVRKWASRSAGGGKQKGMGSRVRSPSSLEGHQQAACVNQVIRSDWGPKPCGL